MKKIFIILFVIIVGAGIWYSMTNRDGIPGEEVAVKGALERITFEMPENFVALEQPHNGQTANLNKIVVLMQSEDYQSVINGEREGGEGPASVTIYEYANPEGLTAKAWAEKYSALSNYQLLGGPVTERQVGGSTAVAYSADGLYANRNVVFAAGDLVYFVSGSYMEQDSALYRAFDQVVGSIDIKE